MNAVTAFGSGSLPNSRVTALRAINVSTIAATSCGGSHSSISVGKCILIRHAPPPKQRIKDRARAEAIAKAATDCRVPLGVEVECKRQAPPRLYDLPALQKVCAQKWSWTADKTLSIAQELYDGDGKKLITYPRAEARHLSENPMADVPVITGALTALRGFAHLDLSKPVIRKGKTGHSATRRWWACRIMPSRAERQCEG